MDDISQKTGSVFRGCKSPINFKTATLFSAGMSALAFRYFSKSGRVFGFSQSVPIGPVTAIPPARFKSVVKTVANVYPI